MVCLLIILLRTDIVCRAQAFSVTLPMWQFVDGTCSPVSRELESYWAVSFPLGHRYLFAVDVFFVKLHDLVDLLWIGIHIVLAASVSTSSQVDVDEAVADNF